MKVRSIGSNQTEVLKNNGDLYLVSYNTVVACYTGKEFFRTSTKHSKTTTKHINQWLNIRWSMKHGSRNAQEINQNELEALFS